MRFFILLALSLSLLSCNNDDDNQQSIDCELVNCQNAFIAIDFLAQSDGENLFTNGTLTRESFQVIDISSQQEVSFGINSEGLVYITPNIESKSVNSYSYEVKSSEETILTFTLDAKNMATSEDCCTVIEFSNVNSTNPSFERNSDIHQVYKVTLNL